MYIGTKWKIVLNFPLERFFALFSELSDSGQYQRQKNWIRRTVGMYQKNISYVHNNFMKNICARFRFFMGK